MNQDEYWINVSKVIGAYLMILGHRHLVGELYTQLIFSFHMPLFFILSGMLYHHRPIKETFKRVLRSLLVPFAIMTLLWIIWYFVLLIKNDIPISNIVPYAIGSIISPGNNYKMFHPLCAYLWFIMALAIIKILTSLVHRKTLILIISMFCLLIDVILIKYQIHLPFTLNSVLLAIPFFAIGYTFQEFFNRKLSYDAEIGITLLGIISVLIIGSFNGKVDINNNCFGNNIFLYLICGITGTMAVFSLSRLLCVVIPKKFKVINVLSKGTLLVVGFSASLSSVYLAICKYLTIPIELNIIGVIVGMMVLVSFYPVTLLADRYFPAIIGFRK